MLERFRQSLAIRLAAIYTVAFSLGAVALFGVLYWVLANSLEQRERAAVELRAEDFAKVYVQGGAGALRDRLNADSSPEVRSLFVRLLGAGGESTFLIAPTDWIDPTVVQRRLVPTGWGGWSTEDIHTVRIPQNALRDYTVASRVLPDGRLIQVARTTDSRAVLLAPLRKSFAAIGVAALFVSLSLGTLLAWRATRPLREVSDTARRILEEDDLGARIPTPTGSGELALLARQLNTLLDKNSNHVRVLRETLDNLAHDMRTPLTRLRGTAELALGDGGEPGQAREALADCVDESDRVLHLLEVLLDVSAAEAGALNLHREPVDLAMLAARAADLYREVAEEKKIQISVGPAVPAPFMGDRIRLGQALSNLLDNALKYTPSGGRVSISTAQESGAVTVTVDDSGPGVPVPERDAIWRRLYRGDASRAQRGLGLGLSLVRGIVEAHGGTAAVSEVPGGGARFLLRFPSTAT